MSLLVPISYWFNECSFVVSFEMEKCEYSSFFLLLKDFLAILGPLSFLMNFRSSLSVSTKKPTVILTGIVFNLANYLLKNRLFKEYF